MFRFEFDQPSFCNVMRSIYYSRYERTAARKAVDQPRIDCSGDIEQLSPKARGLGILRT